METTNSDAKWDKINAEKRNEIIHGMAVNAVNQAYSEQGQLVWKVKETDWMEAVHIMYDRIQYSRKSIIDDKETMKYGSPVQEIIVKHTDLDIEPEFTGIKIDEPTLKEERKMDFDL